MSAAKTYQIERLQIGKAWNGHNGNAHISLPSGPRTTIYVAYHKRAKPMNGHEVLAELLRRADEWAARTIEETK